MGDKEQGGWVGGWGIRDKEQGRWVNKEQGVILNSLQYHDWSW